MPDMTNPSWWRRDAVFDRFLTEVAERKSMAVEEAALDDKCIKEAQLKADRQFYGHDAKQLPDGTFVQQGIGSTGHETANHFAAILRYRGREEHAKAIREIWKRDPARARAIGLPEPQRAA